MAFLMLLHEKLRLQRKVNKLTLRQLKASSRKERITKQIERVQKMYSKRETNLDNMAKRMQSSANMQFRNLFGMSSNMLNMNPAAYMSGGMNNMGVMQVLAQAFKAGKVNSDVFSSMEEYMEFANSNYKQVTNTDGKTVYVDKDAVANSDGKYEISYDSPDQVAIREKMQEANKLQSMAYSQYTMNQNLCNTACTNFDNNVSIWLDYEKAKLEAEQDAALAPLEEQETEWDMESQSCETLLADAKARLESISQALSEGIKDSAPKFGLG